MRATPFAVLTAALLALTAPAAQAEPAPPPAKTTTAQLPNFDLLHASDDPVQLKNTPRKLSVKYTVDGETHTLDEFLARTFTQGFVVLDGSNLVMERYSWAAKDTLFQSWSMAKSFTSAALGIALGEGKITSIDDTVEKYVPELAGTGYGGVSLRNLLRMSSGIEWSEDQDVPPVHVQASLGVPITKLAAQRVRGWEPGSRFEYTSMNSFVLAWVLSRATGTPYDRYVDERLWRPAGMASQAWLGSDSNGNSLGYCCYYATARDFARFGLLFLNGGRANGRQVVPGSWVDESTAPSLPGKANYGLHWWLGPDGEFRASGLGGQTIYVSRRHNVVIVKTTLLSMLHEDDTLPAFRAIAAEVARTR